MKAKRKRHDATFKARVALEAIKSIKTVQQLAKEFDIHPVQVSEWKKKLGEGATGIFTSAKLSLPEDFSQERKELHSKIGQLLVELDFMTKKSKQLDAWNVSSSLSNLSTRKSV